MTPELRKLPPEPLASAPFDIPQPFQTQLDNGLRVVIFEDARLPLVSFRLVFFTGDINDPVEYRGISSAVASMLSEGTANYSSLQLAEKIERLGASVHASASYDFTTVAASSLSLYTDEILELFSEVALRPTFPEGELDLYRRNTIENLKFQRSQPSFLAGEQASRLIYGEHPYSIVSPTAADIEKLDRELLVNFHRHSFIPNNAILIVVGNVMRDDILASINEKFGERQAGELPKTALSAPPARNSRTLTIVDRPGSAQSNIVIGNLGIERTHPDLFPILVMNQVLGAGASSRVFMNLREEKGYTYGAYTRLNSRRLAGDFEATAEVRTAVTGDSLKEFFYEFDRIRNEDVGDDELADAKNFLTGVFPLRAETQEGLTDLIVGQQIYGLPADHLQKYRDRINAVTIADVRRVANEIVRPDEMAIVIVGDAAEIIPQVKAFAATIEVFDTDGSLQELDHDEDSGSDEDINIGGKWNLSIDFQGQAFDALLELNQSDNEISGSIDTPLGQVTITGGTVSRNSFSAGAVAELQGTEIEFVISGKVIGEEMHGSLTAEMLPGPLAFKGVKE